MYESSRNGRFDHVQKQHRFAIAALVLAFVVLVPVPGCILSLWQGALCLSNAYAEWEADVATWPNLAVRIVNNTGATVRVSLTSGSLWDPGCELFPSSTAGAYYQAGDERSLLVAANGTATGTIKCGEIIAIAARAPYDLTDDASSSAWYGGSDFGLYVDAGNVTLSGAGVAGNDSFSGDTVSLVRFVRHVEDGVDCETSTLVIAIETLGTVRVVDPVTGAIIISAMPGTGTISIE